MLARPDMYIGPVEPRNETVWLVKRRRIEEAQLLLSPGLATWLFRAAEGPFPQAKRSCGAGEPDGKRS